MVSGLWDAQIMKNWGREIRGFPAPASRYGKMSYGFGLTDTQNCHICPDQLLNQQPLIFSFLSFVTYLAGIDFLNLTPKGSLLRQSLFAELHPAFTSFPFKLCLKYVRKKGLSSQPNLGAGLKPAPAFLSENLDRRTMVF
jgi:hypothetical protein